MLFKIISLIFFQIFLMKMVFLVSKKYDLIDYPSSRKIHNQAAAFTGGIAIFTMYIVIMIITDYNVKFLNYLISYSLIIVLFGFIDDKYKLSPGSKIFFQIIPIVFLIQEGFFLSDLGNYTFIGTLELGSFKKIFTLLCCLLLINAFNYIDGIDGLASLEYIFILSNFSIFFYLNNNFEVANYILFLILPILIFLFYNFSFFKVDKFFLGDCGSNLLGFIVSFIMINAYSIYGIHPAILIWTVSLIIYDFLTTNIIRFIFSKKIFKPGHDHLHFELQKKYNFNKFEINLIYLIISSFMMASGYLTYSFYGSLSSFLLYIIFFKLYLFLRIKLLTVKSK